MKIHKIKKSTAISHFGYDRAKKELVVQFTSSNKFYTYPKVSKGIFTKMRKAVSVGQFVNEVIIPNYSNG